MVGPGYELTYTFVFPRDEINTNGAHAYFWHDFFAFNTP